MKLTERGIFSETPNWTRSEICRPDQPEEKVKALLTCVILDARRHPPSSKAIKERDILPEHCLEISFSNPFRDHLASVYPGVHKDISTSECTDACKMEMSAYDFGR